MNHTSTTLRCPSKNYHHFRAVNPFTAISLDSSTPGIAVTFSYYIYIYIYIYIYTYIYTYSAPAACKARIPRQMCDPLNSLLSCHRQGPTWYGRFPHVYVYIYLYIYIHACIHTQIQSHTHTHTHTHTYAHKPTRAEK
jgi:hypothetical protein